MQKNSKNKNKDKTKEINYGFLDSDTLASAYI